MKLQVLVLDYDGTIAAQDALDPDVRTAIAEFRAAGGAVVLATGRILDELEHVAGDLRFVDAVVAENGAVVALPAEDRVLVLGHEPSTPLLDALHQHAIAFVAGQCVVEAEAADAPAILSIVRALELPLVLIFNRSRLMILPAGVSKATGLQEALRLLRRSEHNALAIGDAENDHALLDACERGMAVAWGSPALRAIADGLVEGQGPADTARYIARLTAVPQLTVLPSGRRRLLLGHTASGRSVTIPTVDRTVLIVGDSRWGKSYVAGMLAEQLIVQRYAMCVIDPEGDYRALEALPGVVTVGGHGVLPGLDVVDDLLRHPEMSLVVDLSDVEAEQKRSRVGPIVSHLSAMRRAHGLPHRIVLDEAHHFLMDPGIRAMVDADLGAYTLVTYRMADIQTEAWAAGSVVISTRLTDPRELRALRAHTDHTGSWSSLAGALATLALGSVIVLGDGDHDAREPAAVRLASRLTTHVRHRQKYADLPVAHERAFLFTRRGVPTGERAHAGRAGGDCAHAAGRCGERPPRTRRLLALGHGCVRRSGTGCSGPRRGDARSGGKVSRRRGAAGAAD